MSNYFTNELEVGAVVFRKNLSDFYLAVQVHPVKVKRSTSTVGVFVSLAAYEQMLKVAGK